MEAIASVPSVESEVACHEAALDVTSAARRLGVSATYLNKLRSTGGGPTFIKLGTRVTYRVVDLDDWQAKHARTSTADGKAA